MFSIGTTIVISFDGVKLTFKKKRHVKTRFVQYSYNFKFFVKHFPENVENRLFLGERNSFFGRILK